MDRRTFHRALGALALPAAFPATAQTAAYPKSPIRLIVNFPAGGTVDTLARLFGQKLQDKWGQPVTVDNRPGAGGNIGAALVYSAEPDGYNLLVTPPGPLSINQNLYKKLGYEPEKFVPVSMLATSPNVITARADFPAGSVKELLAYAKAHPGKVTYGSQGNGSTSHLTGQMLANFGGVELVHVPYKGEGPALVDLIAGRVDLFLGNISAVAKFRQEGKVKFLAVAAARRFAGAMDVPTAAEAGLPGFEASAWFAVVAPPGTPAAITQKLQGALAEALAQPEVQQRIIAQNMEPAHMSGAELAEFIAAERVRWKKVIATANVTVD
ncbi:MAG TPA: tripartite tricarboxylate transporter substrate binding protein [Burkholderiales bacterium]|jgi:tripartite-type tricarboxylate transporter receptor subunit TctC